jgi:hypothetical protein
MAFVVSDDHARAGAGPGRNPGTNLPLQQRSGRIFLLGIHRMTSSMETKTKLSIDDISTRISMLADVAGRIGLMKRDLAKLMRSIKTDKACEAANGQNSNSAGWSIIDQPR